MALWTAIMGAMAAIGVSLSGVGVYLIWQTWGETHRAANNANRTYEAFVAVEEAKLVALITNGRPMGGRITYDLEIANVGRSSAHIEGYWREEFPGWPSQPPDKFKSFQPIGKIIKKDGTLRLIGVISGAQPGRISPRMGGMVVYRGAIGKHHSYFLFASDVLPKAEQKGDIQYRARDVKPDGWKDT